MKRSRSISVLSVFLICLMLISIITSCGPSKKVGNETATTKADTTAPQEQAATKLPIVDKPLTLTIYMGLNGNIRTTRKDYNEVTAVKELEKRTGIHIEFIHPSVTGGAEQFKLMIASMDLPDMIDYPFQLYPGGPSKAVSDNVLIDLKAMVDKNAPNFKKVLSVYKEAEKQIKTDDGKIFIFPNIFSEPRVEFGPEIRKDWLDKLKLQIPKTVDEWYTTLKAIKEKDPNGNGQPDEIPYLGQKNSVMTSLLNGMGMKIEWYQVNGKVKFGAIEPQFKDYLKTLAQWYKEGLIDPDFVVNDGKTWASKVTGDRAGSWETYVSRIQTYGDIIKEKVPNVKINGVPYPVMKSGEKPLLAEISPMVYNAQGTGITSKNTHVLETVKWLDYLYSDEGQELINFGVKGQTYNVADGKRKFVDTIINNPDKLPLQQAVGQHAFLFVAWPTVTAVNEYRDYTTALPEQTEALKTWKIDNNNMNLPPIFPSDSDSSKFNNIMSEVKTYLYEVYNKTIMGQESVENFDKFVQKLKDMKIDDAIAIQQKALDAYNKR